MLNDFFKAIFIVNYELNKSDGISKKVKAQVDSLGKKLGQCFFSYVQTDGDVVGRFVDGVKISNYVKGCKILNIFISYFEFNSLYKFIVGNDIRFIYIRYSQFGNPMFNFFLRRIKRRGCFVCLEIPTFPYDKEQVRPEGRWIKNFIFSIFLRLEVSSRKRFVKYVDRVITFTGENKIFGIETIKIDNASVPDVKPVNTFLDLTCVKFVGVASLNYWHGYDRLIMSMNLYYASFDKQFNKKIVEFHIVGDGSEISRLKMLVEIYNLEKYVFFHGHLSGHHLDFIITQCHIGVDSLARHRTGHLSNNSLKSKEYLMRGLPIVKSHSDPSVDKSNFCFNVPANEEPFSIEDIIDWYLKREFTHLQIREFGLSEFTWDKQMIVVLDKTGFLR